MPVCAQNTSEQHGKGGTSAPGHFNRPPPIIICNVTKLLNSIQLLLYIESPEVTWRKYLQENWICVSVYTCNNKSSL